MRVIEIPKHARDGADHRALVQRHELLEGLRIPVPHPQHQADTGRIGLPFVGAGGVRRGREAQVVGGYAVRVRHRVR